MDILSVTKSATRQLKSDFFSEVETLRGQLSSFGLNPKEWYLLIQPLSLSGKVRVFVHSFEDNRVYFEGKAEIKNTYQRWIELCLFV